MLTGSARAANIEQTWCPSTVLSKAATSAIAGITGSRAHVHDGLGTTILAGRLPYCPLFAWTFAAGIDPVCAGFRVRIDLAAAGCCGVLAECRCLIAGPAFLFHEVPLYPARRLACAHHNEDHIAPVHGPGRIDRTKRIVTARCSCNMGAALYAITIVEAGLTLWYFDAVGLAAGRCVAGCLEAARCINSVAGGFSIGSKNRPARQRLRWSG